MGNMLYRMKRRPSPKWHQDKFVTIYKITWIATMECMAEKRHKYGRALPMT